MISADFGMQILKEFSIDVKAEMLFGGGFDRFFFVAQGFDGVF